MLTVIEWFLFAMFVWGCVIAMEALQRRFAPEMGSGCGGKRRRRRQKAAAKETSVFAGEDPKDKEIRELRERLQVLEVIVTDRRYQWDEDYRRDR